MLREATDHATFRLRPAIPVPLTGRQKRFLRAQGHALQPLVHVGKQGVAPTVVTQTDSCLTAHELVKVKVLEACPLDRHACGAALAEATRSEVAQTIGRMVLLYRAHPETPRLALPRAAAGEGAAAPPDATADAVQQDSPPPEGAGSQ